MNENHSIAISIRKFEGKW